jgi:hypothetical protein
MILSTACLIVTALIGTSIGAPVSHSSVSNQKHPSTSTGHSMQTSRPETMVHSPLQSSTAVDAIAAGTVAQKMGKRRGRPPKLVPSPRVLKNRGYSRIGYERRKQKKAKGEAVAQEQGQRSTTLHEGINLDLNEDQPPPSSPGMDMNHPPHPMQQW